MSNIYHVEPKGKYEIAVLKGNTAIAYSMCGNLYPTTEATNYDIGLIITVADLYDLFYIPLDKERS